MELIFNMKQFQRMGLASNINEFQRMQECSLQEIIQQELPIASLSKEM